MLHKAAGDLNTLVNRPKIIEDTLMPNYDQYAYMMFMLPVIMNARIVVETGLGWGHSSKIHLESLSLLDQPRELHTYEYRSPDSTDFGFKYSEIEQQVRNIGFKAKWFVHYQDSVQGGREWAGNKIDILYLDSDHSFEHVNKELEAWYPHMNKKCVIYTDDIWCQNTPHQAINKINPGVCPQDPYWSFKNFWDNHKEFNFINLSYPEGKSILVRYNE